MRFKWSSSRAQRSSTEAPSGVSARGPPTTGGKPGASSLFAHVLRKAAEHAVLMHWCCRGLLQAGHGLPFQGGGQQCGGAGRVQRAQRQHCHDAAEVGCGPARLNARRSSGACAAARQRQNARRVADSRRLLPNSLQRARARPPPPPHPTPHTPHPTHTTTTTTPPRSAAGSLPCAPTIALVSKSGTSVLVDVTPSPASSLCSCEQLPLETQAVPSALPLTLPDVMLSMQLAAWLWNCRTWRSHAA